MNIANKYQIIEELGKGGMGCVYKIVHSQLNKVFALKTTFSNANKDTMQRFIREAQVMAKMNHPNIVRVYDVGTNGSHPFFVMDYIEGCSLQNFLKNNSTDVRLLSQIMAKIGKAMAYAHKQGVIHRDLKPSNILIDKNGKPYITDFGLAKQIGYSQGASLTKKGSILGTPKYMSPEQAMGEKVNHLTDIYSLGAIFYEMLTKKQLIEGESINDILYNIIHREPALLRDVNHKLATDLQTICHKAFAKKAEKRYKNAEDLAQDIDRFLHGEIIAAKAISVWEKNWNKLVSNKPVILVLLGGILLLLGSVWFLKKQQNAKVHLYLVEAKKWQDTASQKNSKQIEKQIENYIKAGNILEKALEVSPNNPKIKRALALVQKKMGLLAKEQKNYLLSFVFFKQCKNLGDKEAQKLLVELEEEKSKQKKDHIQYIRKAMKKILKHNSQILIDRYAFAIVKMQKPYVIGTLVSYLKAKRKSQRLLAIRALGKFGNTYTKFQGKDSIQHLLKHLKKFGSKKAIKNSQQEVEEIIWALGWLKDKRASYPVFNTRDLAGRASPLWEKTKTPSKWIPIENKTLAKDANQFNTRGLMKRIRGQIVEAIADYTKAIAINPRYSAAYSNRAIAYSAIKEYAKALADFDKAVVLNPKSASVYNNRASVYHQAKEYTKAITDYTKAIALDPKSSGTYSNRGILYGYKKEYAKALTDFSQAIALNPKHSLMYSNRGSIYSLIKKPSKALADFTTAIALNSRYSDAYLKRGNVYLGLREYEKALADFSKAIALNPKYARVYNAKGQIYERIKEYAKAVANYNKAIALSPKTPEPYSNRASIYLRMRKYPKALADYSKAIALAPKSARILSNRGTAYFFMKEYLKALIDLNKAIAINPKHPELYFKRGMVYSAKKECFKAISDFSKTIALNPKHAESYFRRGCVYEHLKKPKKTYRDFQMCLKLAPYNPSVAKIRATISYLEKNGLVK